MTNLTQWLLNDIADRGSTRDDVATTYAYALCADNSADWPKVNHAIVERWSPYALKYIKHKAWKFAEGWR